MIVVDTNVVAYLCLPSEATPLAEALLARHPSWAAPVLWRSEFRNILAGYLRRNQLTLAQAIAVQAEAERVLAGQEHEVDSARVLELVAESDCSAYDCEFIALALRLGTQVYTLDGKLLRAFPGLAVALK